MATRVQGIERLSDAVQILGAQLGQAVILELDVQDAGPGDAGVERLAHAVGQQPRLAGTFRQRDVASGGSRNWHRFGISQDRS